MIRQVEDRILLAVHELGERATVHTIEPLVEGDLLTARLSRLDYRQVVADLIATGQLRADRADTLHLGLRGAHRLGVL